ncbi:MAG TPA: kelch repeat-containing protein [Planctomycetota bacterium]
MRSMIQVLVIGAVIGAGSGLVSAQDPSTGSWSAEAAGYYFARGGNATDGAYLYVFGGYQFGVRPTFPSYYRAARRYDPASDTWTTLADLPNDPSGITYQYNAGACYDGRLYSFGTSYSGGTGRVLSYSIADDQWSVLSGVTLPLNRYGAAAAVLGDRICITGGYAGGASRRTDLFDPATETFEQRADMPGALYLHAAAAIPWRGTMYAMCGYRDGAYQAVCYQYAPSSDSWTTRAPVQSGGALQPRGFPAAFAVGDRIYLTGGYTGSGSSNTNFEYRVETDSWTPRASMARARYQHAAATINGRGLVYGGLAVYTLGEEFTPPEFGPAPDPPGNLAQIGGRPESSSQAAADPRSPEGWTDGRIVFSATVTDSNPQDQVRLRVRVRPAGGSAWTLIDSGLSAQGTIRVPYAIPAAGTYDWEYRVEDAAGNSFPEGWAPAFGNDRSPDFRSDQVPPTAPVPRSPNGIDIDVPDPAAGLVTFEWEESKDDGPAEALTYELQVARDLEFDDLETSVDIPAGRTSWSVYLAVARESRYWRIRARDIGGNAGDWGERLEFRVTHDDGWNHAAGDGRNGCGYGAGGGGGGAVGWIPAPAVLLGALLLRGFRIEWLRIKCA